MKKTPAAPLLALLFLFFSCRGGATEVGVATSEDTPAKAPEEAAQDAPSDATRAPMERMKSFLAELNARPEHQDNAVKVQLLLVGFRGSVRGKPITRSRDEAEALAAELFSRALDGEDFDALVKEHTDDSHPGIYLMKLELGPGERPPQVFARTRMVGAFGDTGWRLEVGEIGIAPHDPKKSPFGWHIVKRVE